MTPRATSGSVPTSATGSGPAAGGRRAGAVPDVTVVAVSPVYETDPVGGPEQPEYLNAVVAIETDLAPAAPRGGHEVEAAADRVRAERWGPRTLDVDVLLVGDDDVDEPDLVVPHPRMYERAFVLVAAGRPRPDARRPDAAGEAGVRRTE